MSHLSARTVRRWYRIHKWTSLICTAFLLMACLTGLPLVFQDELEPLLEPHTAAAAVPPGTPDASLDRMVVEAKTHFPGLKPLFVAYDGDEPLVFVTIGSIA